MNRTTTNSPPPEYNSHTGYSSAGNLRPLVVDPKSFNPDNYDVEIDAQGRKIYKSKKTTTIQNIER